MKIQNYLRRINVRGNAPVFPDVSDHMCSMYAKRAAERLFGFIYAPADAWDFRYRNSIVWNPEMDTDRRRIARPGHILGIFNSESVHNTSIDGEKDMLGNDRLYTHLALYAGDDAIIHQYAENVFTSDIKRFLEADFGLVEVIAPHRKKEKS